MRRTTRGAGPAVSPAVVLRDVTVRRARRVLVGPASVALEGPALVRLTGANGSGKSTLLRVTAGLQRPTSGRVEATHPVGLLPERFTGAPELRVAQLVDTVRRAAGRPVDAGWRDRVLAALDVEPLLQRPLGGLSHGQSQRTALAAALHVRPPIVLMDEPWDGLDAETGGRLGELLREHAAEALVVVTDHGPAGRAGATVELRLEEGEVVRAPAPAADARPAPVGRVRWDRPDGTRRSGRLTATAADVLDRLAATGEILLEEDPDPTAPGDRDDAADGTASAGRSRDGSGGARGRGGDAGGPA